MNQRDDFKELPPSRFADVVQPPRGQCGRWKDQRRVDDGHEPPARGGTDSAAQDDVEQHEPPVFGARRAAPESREFAKYRQDGFDEAHGLLLDARGAKGKLTFAAEAASTARWYGSRAVSGAASAS